MKSWYRRRHRRVRVALRESQWLMPLIGAVIGALLALATGTVDRHPDPNDWAITVDRARDTMMSILAILFAGLAIVLSLATVTAQTVASRFSLRLLRVHLRGLVNKAVIAIFRGSVGRGEVLLLPLAGELGWRTSGEARPVVERS